MVKYEWDESNGVSVPTNKLMVIDADEYYVGMPLKKVDAETVAPTDGDPEYICLAQRNAGDEIRPLQIPVQEVFPDAVYTKILEDGTEVKVKFGGGGEPDWNASEGEDGYIKNRTHYDETVVIDSVTQTIPDSATVPNGYGTLPNVYLLSTDLVMPEGKYILFQMGDVKIKFYSLPPNTGSASRPTYKEDITLSNGVTIRWQLDRNDPTSGRPDTKRYWFQVRPLFNAELSPYFGQTFSVSLCEGELKKLDPKFLPEGIGGGGDVLNVLIIEPSNNSFTCNKTYNEIKEALLNDVPVLAIFSIRYGHGEESPKQCIYQKVEYSDYDSAVYFSRGEDAVDLVLTSDNVVQSNSPM